MVLNLLGGGGGASSIDIPQIDLDALINQELARLNQGLSGVPQTGSTGTSFQPFIPNIHPDVAASETGRLVDQAAAAARDRARGAANRFGVPFRNAFNPFDFRDQFEDEIQAVAAGIAPGTPNPGAQFAAIDFDDILRREEDSLRRQGLSDFQSQINQFAPPGFANTAIPSSLDDSILDSLIQEQFDPAQGFVQNATARGLLTPLGASGAERTLQQQLSAARSRASDAGTGVLREGRAELTNDVNNLIQQGVAGVGSLTLADFVNAHSGPANLREVTGQAVGKFVDPIRTSVDQFTSDFGDTLEGRLRTAVPTDLFDTSQLLLRGGQAQGAQNNVGALFQAVADSKRNRESPRGLGSQGAF